MQTFLILGKDNNFRQAKIAELMKEYDISEFDLYQLTSDSSIGIAQVRQAVFASAKKPLAGLKKMLVVHSIDTATSEAQNALLKILEEPTQTTVIVMTASSDNQILPTVLSRSQILRASQTDINETESLPVGTLEEIFAASPGRRLLLSENLAKTREEAVVFVDKLAASLEKRLLQYKKDFSQTAEALRRTVQAKKFISGNVNHKLVIDILLLGFPRS
ncbi:MAG: hypothetical protein UV73_C0009G0036 [Candidatus Gottesmanbacteria bacterium GW2011_GWA2_43_14]|uniref:Uncharacterized protein n=1 Tax=Candidatus Gottesmanbacteria bacterium GW2011_GWA2_43_14 TaxID=1618443 RepID=A0A0G1DFM4_9BACT|nr:MAG: hypothetical protein UV73_C0009G0036 [Candidatus Gottesmanbacteria bacterium GW2011_GWA2_43_14]